MSPCPPQQPGNLKSNNDDNNDKKKRILSLFEKWSCCTGLELVSLCIRGKEEREEKEEREKTRKKEKIGERGEGYIFGFS